MHVVGALGLGGGAAPAAVTAPSPTTESVAAGATPAAKTFGAFTDPDGRIASYAETVTNAVGSATWTGTGLGAYTIGSSADGDSGTLALTAFDSGGNPLQTAYHSWDIAAATGGPQPPALVWSQDLTTATIDAATWTLAETSGTITDDSGGTTIGTWTRTSAAGNGTGTWSWEVGANGFGLIGLQWTGSGASASVSARVDFATLPALDWDRDGVVVQMLVRQTYTAALPTGANSEIFQHGVGPNGSALNAFHVSQFRHYQDSGGRDFLRGVAGTFSATEAGVSWSSSSVIVLRLDRANVTMQVVEGATALLGASALDTTTYTYETVGATGFNPALLATGNPWAAGIAAHLYASSRNPIAGGGGEMSVWVSEIAVYTSGIAQ